MKKYSIALLVGFMLVGEIVAAVTLTGPLAPEMRVYRVVHLLEMLLLIAATAIGSEVRGAVFQLVLVGLILSFFGDLVNSFLFDLSHLLQPQTLLSIPPFVAAHLCYVAAFVWLLRHPPAGGTTVTRKQWAALLGAWPVLALCLWWLLIDRNAPPLLLNLSIGYAFVVTLMGCVAVLLGWNLGRIAWAAAIGGLMFVLSDSIFGLYLLDGPARPLWVSQAIWITYFLAQAGISQTPRIRRPAV